VQQYQRVYRILYFLDEDFGCDEIVSESRIQFEESYTGNYSDGMCCVDRDFQNSFVLNMVMGILGVIITIFVYKEPFMIIKNELQDVLKSRL